MQFVKNLLIATKENKYRPHIIRRHGLALSLALIFTVQLIYSVQLSAVDGGKGGVLGYATNINQSDLLIYTNENRVANGLPGFKANPKLASAAQNKANHMIANDYWAHIAPDGTTPWYFFDQAGYAYLVAGENLAYGFDTSLGVVNGWMASQSHRDNVLLPAYEEIGFGIASGANYQGDENTVVVAFYGDPVVSTSPAAAPVQTTTPPEPAKNLPVELVSETTPAKEEVLTTEEITEDAGQVNALTYLTRAQRQVTNFDTLLSGDASWAMYTTVMILGLLSFAYLYRHITYINVIVARGEHMLTAHPLLESSLIFAALWLLLSASYGTVL